MSLKLPYPYQTATLKPKKEPLFTPEDSVEDLLETRDSLLLDLCDLESLRFPTEKDSLNKTLTLRKIQVVQNELLRLSMTELSGKLLKLFGV